MNPTFTILAMAVLVVATPRVSDAEPRPTCKAMCQRLTDCKMPSYVQRCMETCKPHETTEEGRAQILAFTRYSCDQVRSSVPRANRQQRSSTRTEKPAADDGLDGERDDADMQGGNAEDERDGRSRGVQRPARGAAGPRRADTGKSSDPGDNCAPVCGRFDQCRLWKYDSCIGFCSANTNDPAKNLSAAQWSCPKLGTWMQQLGVSGSGSRSNSGSSGGVTCTAEASVGSTQGNMPTIYQTITATGHGTSRAAASAQAVKDCGALVSTALNLAWLSGDATEGGNCAVTRCTP